MPSPDPERPGLFIRDPYHYSDATLLVPPFRSQALECFDGMQSTLDLRSELVRITGEIQVGELEKHLFDALDEAGFLENESYRELKLRARSRFCRGDRCAMPIFAGSAYPQERISVGGAADRPDRRTRRARGNGCDCGSACESRTAVGTLIARRIDHCLRSKKRQTAHSSFSAHRIMAHRSDSD